MIYNECKKNGFKIDEAINSAVEQMVSSHDYISLQKDCINDEDLDRLFDYIICYLGIYNFNILPESQIKYYYSKFKEIYVQIDVEDEEEEEEDDSEYVYESDEDSDEDSDENSDDESYDNKQPFLVSPLLRRRMNISDDECKNTKDEEEDEEEEEEEDEEEDDDDDSDYVYELESDDDESDDDESDDDESDDDESDDENNFYIDTIKQYLSNGWIDKDGNQCYCIKWKGFQGYMIMLPKNFIEIRFEHDDDNYVTNAFVRRYINSHKNLCINLV